MYDLLIKNGTITTSEMVFKGCVAVKGEKIAAIFDGEPDGLEAREVVDAKGMYVFPGVIDTHAHLNDPGFTWREDFAHGSAAAAVGGITTIIDMPLQNKPALTDTSILEAKEKALSPQAHVDYAFWGGLIDTNMDKLEGLHDAGCVAFKSFIGPVSPDYVSLTMGQVREILEILQKFDGRAGFHCEDFSMIKWGEHRVEREKKNATWQDFLDSRPLAAEFMATQNIIQLAKETGCKVYICHISHPEVSQLVKEGQADGVDVIGETCTHYLTFTEEDVLNKGELFKCAPPLRDKKAQEGLWKHIEEGVISCVGSDHSPCAPEEKSEKEHGVLKAWGGISGIQNILQVMFDQAVVKRGLCPSLVARSTSYGGSKAFRLWGKKGDIRVGFDADLVILDPEKSWTITPDSLKYLNKISAFCGLSGKGLPVRTFVRGKTVALNGEVCGEQGYGKRALRVDR